MDIESLVKRNRILFSRVKFGELLQLHEKNHKSRPVQFNSVAVGVKLSLNTQNNKRRTPKADKKTKVEHIIMEQLQIWKQEKERKIAENRAALNKKKPSLVGVAHNPKTVSFVPINTTFNSTQNVVKLPLNTPSIDANKGTSKLSLGLNTDNKTTSKALKSGSGKNNKNNAQSKYSESSRIVDSSLPIVKKIVLTETVLSKKISLKPESSGSISSLSLEKKSRSTRKINRNFETTSSSGNHKGLRDDGVYEMDTLDHREQQLDSEIKRMNEMCTWIKLFQLGPLAKAIKKTVLGLFHVVAEVCHFILIVILILVMIVLLLVKLYNYVIINAVNWAAPPVPRHRAQTLGGARRRPVNQAMPW